MIQSILENFSLSIWIDLKTICATSYENGLIPGPEETEEAFQTRSQYCLNLKKRLACEFNEKLPFTSEDLGAEDVLEEALSEVKQRYQINPSWIPIFFSRYKLLPWHGGCAWIFKLTKEEPTAALMQLRPEFKKSRRFLKIYDRKELIAHELCHVGRMMYNEPKFEEFLAYRLSKSRFRRFFGPIISSSLESVLFILALLTLLFIDVAFIFSGATSPLWLKLIPLGLVLIALVRLVYRHRCLNRASQTLQALTPNAEAILFRLTDREIFQISRKTAEDTKKYLLNEERKTPREKMLKELLEPPKVAR